VYSPAKLAETGTAEFQNTEEVLISHDVSANMIPVDDFNRQKREKEVDSLTAKAMASAAENGFKGYVDDGIAEIEQYLQEYNSPQQYEHLYGLAARVEFWRKSETS
jgi:hypothetical protein